MQIKTGTFTTSGTGSTSTFSWPHGCTATPDSCIVSPLSKDTIEHLSHVGSHAISYTWGSTDITATYYNDSPPTGSNNVSFSWIAIIN